MPAIKVGPLTRAEIQAVWEGSVDKAYRDPFVAAGEGRGFEVWTQYFAQLERASKAIDVTTQAMFISPWSGQTNPPAAGAANATVTLSFTRTKLLDRLLILGAGLIYVGEQTTDAGEDGGVVVVTGRRYVLLQDLVFQPGEQGPFTVAAEAERPGYGYNNPLPNTISLVSQPGSGFLNTGATVVTSAQPASSALVPSSTATITATVRPDMFVPDHVGQYLQFTAGANVGKLARMTKFGSPTPGVIGSSVNLELHYSVALTGVVGAFQTGEALSFSSVGFGSLVAFSAGTGRMALLFRNGTPPAVGSTVTGLTSGATATVGSVLFSTAPVAEAGAAAWKVLDWAADWGLTVGNVAQPAGGLAPFLDELGDERGIGRSPGELDEPYRARVREIADVVTPNAIRRAMNRSFPGRAWTLREAGSVNLPGFFYDGTNEAASATPGRASCDAYDLDVISIHGGTTTGSFDFQEPAVWEDAATSTRYATGFVGLLVSGTMTFVRKSGDLPASSSVLSGSRVRGLHSGAQLTAIDHAQTFASTQDRDYRTWLDYEQFRGFFDITVEKLGLGEFGFAYDVTGANPYDVSVAYDGFPRLAADVYRAVFAAVDNARAGGVGFQLVLPDERVARNLTVATIDAGYADTLGGSWRLLTGAGFTGVVASDVRFDPAGTNTPATSVIVADDAHLYVKVPAHAAGVVTIAVGSVATLTNCLKYWDPTVPGTPTWFSDHGRYSQFTYNGNANARHWVRRAGSFNVGGVPVEGRSDTNFGSIADVDVEGRPLFGTSNGDSTSVTIVELKSTTSPPDATSITFDDLMGGSSNVLPGTMLFAGNVERIVSAPPGSLFSGDGIMYDAGQNRNALFLDTTPQVRWMWWDGSFKNVSAPLPAATGPFAVAVIRDTTSTPFMRITTDGASWFGSIGTTNVANMSAWQRTFIGKNDAFGNAFKGIGHMAAFYKIQLTAQDITDFYGWWNAEYKQIRPLYKDDPTGWFGDNDNGTGFTGVPWSATESNGISGGRLPLVTPGGGVLTAPTVGTAVNGKTPASFNGTSSALTYQIVTETRNIIPLDPGPFTLIALVRATAAIAAGADFSVDAPIFRDENANLGLVYTSSGFRFGVRAPTVNTPFIAYAVGGWAFVAARYDAANIDLRVNTTDAASTPATAHSAFTAPFRLGYAASGTAKFQGDIMAHRVFARKLSNAELLVEYAAYKTKYPATGLP